MNMSKVLLVYNLNSWRVICIVNLEVSQCVGAPFTQNLGDGHSVQGSGFVHQIFSEYLPLSVGSERLEAKTFSYL